MKKEKYYLHYNGLIGIYLAEAIYEYIDPILELWYLGKSPNKVNQFSVAKDKVAFAVINGSRVDIRKLQLNEELIKIA